MTNGEASEGAWPWMFQPTSMDLSRTKAFSARERNNLVRIDNLLSPEDAAAPFDSPAFSALVEALKRARERGRPVVCFIGAHVIKCGLSRHLIRLMEMGYVTHLASNGAGSIHDFELAYLGGTSEHVPTAIEDGSFGMWEETGRWMNEAIAQGHRNGWGYGQSLAEYVDKHKSMFPHREDCVFYRGYQLGVPVTYHITIGADIIHQHPAADFAAIGGASGVDFAYFCASVAGLDDGVFMNVGSAVTGAEVFLKALSIARNQGHPVAPLTTANFDIIPLGDYTTAVSDEHYHYYYRPRKNVLNRPVSLGGQGLYIEGNHRLTVPNLYRRLAGGDGQ